MANTRDADPRCNSHNAEHEEAGDNPSLAPFRTWRE
jgi:hypothetical protein